MSTHHVVMSQPELGPEGVQIVGFGHGCSVQVLVVVYLQVEQTKMKKYVRR